MKHPDICHAPMTVKEQRALADELDAMCVRSREDGLKKRWNRDVEGSVFRFRLAATLQDAADVLRMSAQYDEEHPDQFPPTCPPRCECGGAA